MLKQPTEPHIIPNAGHLWRGRQSDFLAERIMSLFSWSECWNNQQLTLKRWKWKHLEITALSLKLALCSNFGNGRCFFLGLVCILLDELMQETSSHIAHHGWMPTSFNQSQSKLRSFKYWMMYTVYYNTTHLHHTSHCNPALFRDLFRLVFRMS